VDLFPSYLSTRERSPIFVNSNFSPSQNPPTVAALAVAFYTSLINWLVASIDAPAEVEVSGAALLIAVGAVVIGRYAQGFTDPKETP
jgi:hypothetical protein